MESMDTVVDELEMHTCEHFIVNPKEVVEGWKQSFLRGELTPADFENFWKQYVPRMFAPTTNQSCLNWNFNEDLAKRILFNSLEEFICDGDPAVMLEQLKGMDKPPSVCGRVFKMGEPTYSCRECGMDNTCVLCVECFRNSEHRFHKYKMGTSLGGGCCDCGDTEAWKTAPFCSIHIEGTMEDDNRERLPQAVLERTRIVFEAALWYAYHKLNSEDIFCKDSLEDEAKAYDNNIYCTILYNDEIHTFEQVINTLRKVLSCNQRTAIEFVTNIDREGRAVVQCAEFKVCQDLQLEIKKYTSRHGNKPLKVLCTHAYVIAYQIHAMRLLSWLQSFLVHGEAFRTIFAEVVLKQPPKEPTSIIKGILLCDSALWKSARTLWHRLLIAGMLLEYENKKALAKIFTRNYGQIMKDFIKDDHDHSYSITSLSVQLYTVPTLAHHLIAYDDVLYIIMNTFMSECNTKCNKANKLEFERSPASQTFKRAQYTLYDLKYLLNAVPETWNDDLRRSFLHGLSVMLNLLSMMQGMDAVTRQVGQHMEYEPEWESAFNLHIKLAFCISLALKWCGTDKVVLVKAYRATLKKIEENPCYEPNEAGEVRELADHSTACLHYDVATKSVSIHQPLSRFLAGLHLYLEKYKLHFDGTEFQVVKPTPVQIIEPILRCQVMIAQVHSGMWRRNGYALLNQLYFYHNVKCRTEMLDRDITLLQVGASLLESNEFIIHVLNKFNLINWATPDFEVNSLKSPEEDGIRQTINLVEEFLQLMIVIIGERYMPGISNVTTEDRIKKEIIQHLCIKPMPHSELSKTIPDDLAHETILDDVIDELAEFKMPTQSSGKGVYQLKPEYTKDYNVFYYHYTKEELSKSEETQRKRQKDAGELECCPPPKLPKLNESFTMIVNLLQCDVMLHVMQTVLTRCLNLRARSFSELQLHKVLHVIGYGLQEEECGYYPFFKFIEQSTKFNIPTLIEELLSCPRVEAHKDLVKWTLNKYRQLSNKKDTEMTEPSTTLTPQDTPMIVVDKDKERRAKLAAERRAKLMAQMTTMQNNFMKENAKLFEETNTETKSCAMDSDMDTTEHVDQPIALGLNQTTRIAIEKTYTCILCQEEEKVTATGNTLVFAAFVQQATVLCQIRNNDMLMDVANHDPLFLHSNLGPAPHTSTCGHVMHSDCWRKYFDNVMLKEHRRPYRLRHPASFDVDKQEFLCPLCECLSNTVLPLVPPLSTLQPTVETDHISFNDWLSGINMILQKKIKVCHGIFKCNETCENLHCAACISASNGTDIDKPESPNDCEANCTLQPHQEFYSIPVDLSSPKFELNDTFKRMFFTRFFCQNHIEISAGLKEMLQLFGQVTYTRGLIVNPHPTDKRLAPLLWKSLSYTIHSVEVLLRDVRKPLLGHLSSRQRDSIESLVRIVGCYGCTVSRSVVVQNHCLKLLTFLLENNNEAPSILQWDSLGFLIPLTFSLPSLGSTNKPIEAPTGNQHDAHTLRLIFISHIVKILILIQGNTVNSQDQDAEFTSDEDLEDLDVTNYTGDLEILEVTKMIGLDMFKHEPAGRGVWKRIQDACSPFLRCCVLFYHYLTDVPAPHDLLEAGGDTFSNMCKYLDLPQSPKELFGSTTIMNLAKLWCSHEEVQSYFRGVPLSVVQEPMPVPKLVELPMDYSELINMVSTFTCPNSDHEDSRNPTMCLVCGEILCSQSYCCQTELNKTVVGACNYHAHKCGAGVGIFLRVRECEILFLATPHRGCFVTPPYLDNYGETDQGLRRGNPLKLCEERYKKLNTLWLSHCIHEHIARSIESSNHIVATQWHHF